MFVIFEMRSWFVKLKPSQKVAKCFGTKLILGWFIMSGLPMGWAWAPIIAQFSAEGVAARILKVVELLKKMGVNALAYIDNIILALDKDLAARIDDICEIINESEMSKVDRWRLESRSIGLEHD